MVTTLYNQNATTNNGAIQPGGTSNMYSGVDPNSIAKPVVNPISPTSNTNSSVINNTSPTGSDAPLARVPISTPTPSNNTSVQTAIYDPKTGLLQGYKNNATGIVTSISAPSSSSPTSTGNPAADYLSGTDFTPPPTEDQNYKTLLDRASGLITSINSSAKDKEAAAASAASARVNAGGLAGSSAGGAISQEAIQPILDARDQALGQVYQDIQTNADNLTLSEKQLADTEAGAAVAYQKQAKADALASAQTSVAALAKNGFDYNAAQVPGSPNYSTYQNLLTQVGGDPNILNAMFAQAQPPENVVGSYFTSDGSGGTTVNQVVQDPVTGKISHLNYNIPGYSVPQNWTAQKIGTNGQLLTSPNFNSDPSNPANWTFMSIDPTNNGAITVVSNGQTTVNGVPVNNSSPTAITAEDQANQAYATQVINNTATFSGVSDPSQPLSDAIANANVGIDGIVAGLIKQEGGSPKGVVNNPGNIKFTGAPGQTNSGVSATDGGTFASYPTLQAGTSAVGTLVQNASDAGKTFQQFVSEYKGLNPTPSSTTSPDDQKAQNYATDILNGNITSIASVPKGALRDKVAEILANGSATGGGTGSSKYSPLAASRFTMASNRIVANYLSNPAYTLTAGGEIYLGRIAAAMKTPGSISDQDLLDSLTKLNTGGNAISDAQVGLVTGGKSFADTASVLGNKLKNGGVLSDNQRQQLSTIANAIFTNYKKAYQPIYDQATSQLKEAGIPEAFWTLPDLNKLSEQGLAGTTDNSTINTNNPTSSDYQNAPDGSNATLENGTNVTKKNGIWTDPQGNTYDNDGNPSIHPKVMSFLNENGVNPNSLTPDQHSQLRDSIIGIG